MADAEVYVAEYNYLQKWGQDPGSLIFHACILSSW